MSSKQKFPSNAIERLRTKIAGPVILPGDKDYDDQRTPWLQVVEQHPSAIVNATSVQDIVETVRTARTRPAARNPKYGTRYHRSV